MSDTEKLTGEALEQRLEELVDQETFPPPEHFVEQAEMTDDAVYDKAASDHEGWWAEQAERLDWISDYDTVLDTSDKPTYRWFTGGTLNVSANCLDRHVDAGIGDRVAIHWAGEEGETRDLTYSDLLTEVKRFANALKDRGIGKGDVVGIWMPMIPEAVVAMLACARIGAPHNVVFAGFSPQAVGDRMEVSEAKAVITVDGTRRKGSTSAMKGDLDEKISGLDHIETVVVVENTGDDCPMTGGRDVTYADVMEAAEAECEAECEPEPMDAEDPLFILYSSGSTGAPKGIVHTTGGYLTGVTATTSYAFDLKPESDVFWCTADVGWITGHSYIVYGPMANGATQVIYEGAPDYPRKSIFWELVERYGVTIFYTAPTAVRTFMKWGADIPHEHDLSSLRLLGSVGEPINPKAWAWYHHVIGNERCPIIDTWWQTETGGMQITPLPAITTTKPGSACRALPGAEAKVFDDDGIEVEDGTQGYLVLTKPWPHMLRTLYKDPERFKETYWEKYGPDVYFVGDAARRDEDGYMWVIGRVDDVLNVSGHRLSTGEIESAIVRHAKVAEAAVIGQSDEETGQAVAAFVTLEDGAEESDQLKEEINETIAEQIGKIARAKRIIWAGDLPKTRSGKIMRRLLRDIADGNELGDVSTLRDPDVVSDLESKYEGEEDDE
ncbi:MAG: acetate--CoA ligase [Solirubrobacterales bacterium]